MSLSYKHRKKTLSREQRHSLTKDTIGQTCPHMDKLRLRSRSRKLWATARKYIALGRKHRHKAASLRTAARILVAEIETLSPVAREY